MLSWTAPVIFIVVIGGVGSQRAHHRRRRLLVHHQALRGLGHLAVHHPRDGGRRDGGRRPQRGRRAAAADPPLRGVPRAAPARGQEETDAHDREDVYILDAVRTPVGRLGGALAGVRPDDLAATAVRAVVDRSPDLDPAAIDEVYFGDANGAGEDNRNVARMAVLLAGLPVTIPGATVNRLCGSGLEAVIDASRAVAVGDADLVLAGGVESMSRAPWVLPKPAKGFPTGHEQLWSTTLGWRMTNPRMPTRVDRRARRGRRGAGRQVLDQPGGAGRVRARLPPAGRGGVGRGLVRRRGGAGRATASSTGTSASAPTPPLEKLAALKPAFRAGRHGHRRQRVADERRRAAARAGLRGRGRARRRAPLARIVARATSGVEPHLYGIGPVDRGPHRAAPGRSGLGRPRRGRAERGVRRPEPGLPGRVARPRSARSSTRRAAPSPSAIRSAAPAPAS